MTLINVLKSKTTENVYIEMQLNQYKHDKNKQSSFKIISRGSPKRIKRYANHETRRQNNNCQRDFQNNKYR